ncbi:MAG: threonine/serine exporter ThrE family protein [Phycisphaerales bacterium]
MIRISSIFDRVRRHRPDRSLDPVLGAGPVPGRVVRGTAAPIANPLGADADDSTGSGPPPMPGSPAGSAGTASSAIAADAAHAAPATTPKHPAAGEGPAPATPEQMRRELARQLVVRIGAALHATGTPSDRLETSLEQASIAAGTPGTFFVTPTAIMASFHGPDSSSTLVVRTEAGDVDLGRMTSLLDLVDELVPDQTGLERAKDRLDALLDAPPAYGPLITTLAFAATSATVAIFLGGSAVSGLIGAAGATGVAGGLAIAGRHPRFARVFLVLAASTVSFGSGVLAPMFGLDAGLLTLATLIILLPGLSLTLAMRELAARHLVSGGARLMGALIDFLSIAFGIALGDRLAGQLSAVLPSVTTGWPSLGPGWLVVGLLVAPCSFSILFRAPMRAVPAITLTSITGFLTARGAANFDPILAPMIAAVAAGIIGNLFSRLHRMPAAAFLVPGILLLVPGSLGVRSIGSLMAADALGGLATAANTILIGTAIAAGLLVANAAVPPGRGR